MAYYGTQKSRILVPYFLIKEKVKVEKRINESQKIEVEFLLLKEKLNEIIENEKPYLNSVLTLNLLAKDIKTTNKKLSKLFNQYLRTSFYSFINKYRVNYFIEKNNLSASEGLTIEGLVYECGFNSKASFYRIFKKETGVTPPSEYKKMLNK